MAPWCSISASVSWLIFEPRVSGFASFNIGQEEKQPRQSLEFEQLVDEILFKTAISGQEIFHKQLGVSYF
jgi:hypothetical protein